MKNVINYYYNFFIDKISIINDDAIILYQNETYIFKKYYGDINKTKEIMDILDVNHINYYKVVININNEIITKYNNYDYILIKIFDVNKNIGSNFLYIECLEPSFNIANIWEQKIDYYMNQINKLSYGKEILINTFNYYVGLAENAISVFNLSISINENVRYVIGHYRIRCPNICLYYLDPSNMVIDNIARDLAEYVKSKFFNKSIDISEVIELLHKYNYNSKEVNLFISRLLYPSYYFDIFEDEIISNEEEEILNNIISKIDDYEIFLKNLFLALKKEYLIIEIEWLKKEL